MDFRGQPGPFGQPVFLPPGSFGVPPVHHVGLTAEGIRGGTSFEQNLHAIGPLNPLGLVATGPGAGVDARATTSTARDARRDGGANGPRPKVMCEHPGCGKVFAWSQDLAKHVKKIHNREAPKFHCAHEGCGKAFHEKKLLTAHTRTHTDERPFACPHPGCDKAFRARNALAYHRKALHESGDVLRCDAPGCKFTTKKRDALDAHAAQHEVRNVAKAHKAAQRGEVLAAVKLAKDELRGKTDELNRVNRALATERKAREKTAKRVEAAKLTREKLRRKAAEVAAALEGTRVELGEGGGAVEDASRRKRAKTAATRPATAAAAGRAAAAAADVASAPPEVLYVDGARGEKTPMLCVDGPAALRAASDDAMAAMDAAGAAGVVPVPVPVAVPVPPVPIVVVGGRRTRPVCAQALPWARGFIGCPGIACDASHDFTSLFDHDGARACGNRKSTPLEVDNPKDATHFRARSAECPWSRRRVQRTLERASDPVTLRALLDEFAPRAKAVKKKHVDGQCSSCYSAHMTLIRSMDARKKLATSRRGGGGRGNDGEGDARAASGVDVG